MKYFAILPAAALALFAVAGSASATSCPAHNVHSVQQTGSGYNVVDSGTTNLGLRVNNGGQGFNWYQDYETRQNYIECTYTNRAGNIAQINEIDDGAEYNVNVGDAYQGEKVCGSGGPFEPCS